MERKPFYVGVRQCGCITAAMIDDASTSAGEVADFAREMAKTHRRVEHRDMTHDEFMRSFRACECPHEPPNTQVQP